MQDTRVPGEEDGQHADGRAQHEQGACDVDALLQLIAVLHSFTMITWANITLFNPSGRRPVRAPRVGAHPYHISTYHTSTVCSYCFDAVNRYPVTRLLVTAWQCHVSSPAACLIARYALSYLALLQPPYTHNPYTRDRTDMDHGVQRRCHLLQQEQPGTHHSTACLQSRTPLHPGNG